MENWVRIQQVLLPDLVKVFKKRYGILRHILYNQPIGRRTLASSLNLTERVLRSEVDFLKSQGLIKVDHVGMQLTEDGMVLLEKIEPVIKQLFGLTELEERLAARLSLKDVTIVPGDADQSEFVLKELGKVGAKALMEALQPDDIVGVTGGSTVAAVAEMMNETEVPRSVTFVPARGGLGEQVEYQANTLASQMAKKTNSNYRMLHVPDRLSDEAYHSLMEDPGIQEIIRMVKSASVVIHGIGEAFTMAKRRKADASLLEELQKKNAVAEAFGYYFDREGKIVYKMPTIGLQFEDVQRAKKVIAIAGGSSKSEAIVAFMKHYTPDLFITDEGTANAVLASP